MMPLPPLETQKRIAKTLDAALELLTMRKQQLAELDNLIKLIFYDMFGDPVTNDKGWERKKLSSCCYINPKKTEINYFTDDLEVSFIAMSSVSTNGEINTSEIKKYKEVKTGFTYFYENDVLFAKITPCMENGKGAIARGLKNHIGFGSTEFHVLRPKKGISNSQWLYYLSVLPMFRNSAEKFMTGSAGQKRVPASFFSKFLVPLPPFPLQVEFAKIIMSIEEQKALVKKAIEETQLLFDSLMSQYFD
jgi:type I restriction enzyme S subunit